MYRRERPLAEIIPPDRRRLYASALVLGGMIAGAALLAFVQHLTKPGPPPEVVVTKVSAPGIVSFSQGAGLVDITSPRAGEVVPDGQNDQSFELVVDGAVAAVRLGAVDSTGHPFGMYHWGTSGEPRPWQLAVFEDGVPLNAGDGSLHPLSPGRHRLRLYASDNGSFEPGSYFRAYVIRPNGDVTTSEPLAFTGHGPAHERPPAPATTFNRDAAAEALGKVNVRACDLERGADGPGHVTVVFAPDGTISSVEVDHGGNEKTPRGACIARAFRAARVPPFAGAPVRVGKSFTAGLGARGPE